MILLDTHIWIWWVQGESRLDPAHGAALDAVSSERLALSAFSCWEVVKLHEHGRLILPNGISSWLVRATVYPRLDIIPVTTEIAIGVAELPPGMHRDPADQIIVATARVLDCPLLIYDRLILKYPHVKIYR
jgi:PIN domain nuclease of toxin-antitoxin system